MNEFRLDRPGIRASFDRASPQYEAAAVLQARVNEELMGRLEFFKFQPRVVLDLGAGTGRGAEELKRRYRRALVVAVDMAPGMLREAQRRQHLFRRFERVCADAMRLPFADSSVDVVFSSLMLQWCDPLDVAFAEVRRVLKPAGFFAFSTFGPDTLKELRAAWAEADGYNHVNQFVDMHDVGEALVRAGLVEPVLDVDRIQVTYADTLALMKDLKAIGAHNVTAGRSRGLMGRARLARVQAAYETFRRDGRLPASYEVIYGATWGAAGRTGASIVGGEVRIPPERDKTSRAAMTQKSTGIFVTGTDTGVGKTLVSVSLVKSLVERGLRVSAMKPLASGSEHTPEGLRNEDALSLAAASNVAAPYSIVNPYCFEPAISPHIAAEEAGIDVDLHLIRRSFDTLAAGADWVVVEGAGGWYAPISRSQSMSDLPKLLDVPVLLVVGLRLGCLNHALLTKRAIEAEGARFAGWVANTLDPKLERLAQNLSSLERRLGGEPLSVFPFAPGAQSDARAGEQLARGLSLLSF